MLHPRRRPAPRPNDPPPSRGHPRRLFIRRPRRRPRRVMHVRRRAGQERARSGCGIGRVLFDLQGAWGAAAGASCLRFCPTTRALAGPAYVGSFGWGSMHSEAD